MAKEAIAANLRRLRSARGMTQRELAEAAGISVAGYRNIENRVSAPRMDTLEALRSALDVPIQDLVTPVPELRAVRFRSFKRLKIREQVLAEVGGWLQDFRELEYLLDDREDYPLLGFRAAKDEEKRPIAAARWVRKRFGLDEDEPIRDICGLLESNGIKMRTGEVQSDAFFGLSIAPGDGGPAIAVNTWSRISVERWIFTAAHELGHLVLHCQDYEVSEKEESQEEEREANLFAGHFLMPDGVFRSEWDATAGLALVERVLKVKRIFRVSYRTVLYRLAEGGDDAFQASFPESSPAGEPEKLSRADFVEDRLSRLVRKAVERSAITLSRAAEIFQLSLPAMRQLSASWVR